MIKKVVKSLAFPVVWGVTECRGLRSRPPYTDDIQVWLKGNDDGTDLKLDSWKKPYAENWKLSQSACVALNGVGELGSLTTGVINFLIINATLLAVGVVNCRVFYSGTGWYTDDMFLLQLNINGTLSLLLYAGGISENLGLSTIHSSGDIVSLNIVRNEDNTYTIDDGVESITSVNPYAFAEPDVTRIASDRTDGSNPEVQFWDLTVNDYHFRCAENSGLTSFSSNYLTDGKSITWSADVATLRAQRQDTYPSNALLGWWEITGDPVMYPYPVVGFDVYHKAGTFTDCESKLAPESFPVGTANGVDHEITMLADHGTIVSHGSLDTSVPTYVHPTITFTAGTIRDILFSDGTFMQLREGSGSDVHNQDGVIIGALSGDPVAFYAGAYMVSQEIIDMEAASTSGNFFADVFGHPLPMAQAGWDELGAESVENGQMIHGTDGYGTIDSTLSVEDGRLKVLATDVYGSATTDIITESGKTYKVSLDYFRGDINGYIEVKAADGTTLYTDSSSTYDSDKVGIFAEFTAIGGVTTIRLMNDSGAAENYNFWDNISVREVNQVINNNKQYYFTSCDEFKRMLILYKTPRTDAEDTEIKVFGCL